MSKRSKQTNRNRSVKAIQRKSLTIESLEQRIVLASDWQNSANRFDVDDNPAATFDVVPLDALLVINELNDRMFSSSADGALTEITAADPIPEAFFDVSGDGLVTPLDAIQVINRLNLDFSGSSDAFIDVNQLTSDPATLDSLVNSTTSVPVNSSSIASGGNQAVVVWEQFDRANESWSVLAQRYDVNGAKRGDPILVNGGTDQSSRRPAVAVNSLGDIAVAWQFESVDGDWDIAAAILEADGTAADPFLAMNTFSTGNQTKPDVVFTNDSTISVVWEGTGTGDHNGIFQREFRLNATPIADQSGESLVNTQTDGRQSSPALAATSDGRTIVTWQGVENVGSGDDEFVDSIYTKITGGPEQLISTADRSSAPGIAIGDDDSALITWKAGDSLFARSIDASEITTPALSLSFTGLESLGDTHNYEAWVIVDGQPVSAGVFDVDSSGALIDSGGNAASFTNRAGATTVVISIEPENDVDPAPSNTKILAGELDANGQVNLTTEHPAALNTDFFEASGEYIIATPTTVTTDDQLSGVWFLNVDGALGDGINGLDLPVLPIGWEYEGWAVIDGEPVSTGRFTDVNGRDNFAGFSGPEATPNVPGEDFISNAPDGLTFPTDLSGATIVVSVEPEPDNSSAPFALKPLAGQVPDPAMTGINYAMTNNYATSSGVSVRGSGISGLISPATPVSLANSGVVSGPRVAPVPGGGFAINWSGFEDGAGTAQSDSRVFLQEFANGMSAGDPLTMNNGTILDNPQTDIVALGNQYVSTWQGRVVETTGVFARMSPASIFASDPFRLNAISDLTLDEGGADTVTYFVVPTIVDLDNTVDSPTFSVTTDFPGVEVDASSGQISIPLPETAGGTEYDITLTATEGEFSQSQTFHVTVADVNLPPTLAAIDDQTASIRNLFSLQFPAAVDTDVPVDTVSYTVTLSDGSDLPPWLSFSPDNRTIFGTPSARHIGVVNLLVTASDGTDSSTEAFAITIQEPFSIVPLGDVTVGSVVTSYESTASINDTDGETDVPLYSITTDAPEGATIDATTGDFSIPISEAMRGNTYTVTVTASDRDHEPSTTFTLSVDAA